AAVQARRGLLRRRRGHAGGARARAARRLPLRRPRRAPDARGEPERRPPQHRRRVQRRAERHRAHAAPRARRRAPDRQRGRPPALPLGPGLGGARRGRGAGSIRARMSRAVTAEVADEHGLTREEWAKIVGLLGRPPTLEELGVFAVMWSEHCSYKSSRAFLRQLPTRGPRVLQGPGENAGAVDIGDGLAAVFKIESHNHPSFVEPFQGAATGVGGILRDAFTEKLLLEACLELMAGDDIVAIQDMGAAGLTSSSLEMAGRGGMGMVLELDRVPLREEGMTPYDILLSESQERMLLVAQAGREAAV